MLILIHATRLVGLLTPLEHLFLLLFLLLVRGLLILLLVIRVVVVLPAASVQYLLQVVDHLAVFLFHLLLVGLLWYHGTLRHCSIMDLDFFKRRCKLMIVVQARNPSLMVGLLSLRQVILCVLLQDCLYRVQVGS